MDSYNKADRGFGDYTPFDIGPAEFVNLIRNAKYIFTDSFHGSVFSMLYKNSFLYSTAIQTILYLPKTPALTAFVRHTD